MNPAFKALQSMVSRADGWINPVSGIGDPSWDRSVGTTFEPEAQLDWAILSALFRNNGLCRRIVSLYPEEALRRTPTYEGPKAEALEERLRDLDLRGKLEMGLTMGRLYGGAIAVLCTDDNVDPREPLPPGPHHITGIDVYDRREIEREARFDDGPMYSHTRIFRVQPISGGTSYIHRSRCLVFGSVKTDSWAREGNAGWDDSALQAPYNVIRGYDSAYSALSNLLTDASQAVIKIAGLMTAIAQSDGPSILAKRAQVMALGRSIAKALFLDADLQEEYTKVSTSFAGIPDSVAMFGSRLAAETGYPLTKLLGASPGGLNATGESDDRNWYGQVTIYRGTDVEPHYKRVVDLLAPGHVAKWPPLWTPTEKEAAETRLARVTADAKYIEWDVALADEVALARNGDDEIKIDPRPRLLKLRSAVGQPTVSPAKSNVVLAPTDVVTFITVNQALEAEGLPPLAGPEGLLTVSEYQALHSGVISQAKEASAPPQAAPRPAT